MGSLALCTVLVTYSVHFTAQRSLKRLLVLIVMGAPDALKSVGLLMVGIVLGSLGVAGLGTIIGSWLLGVGLGRDGRGAQAGVFPENTIADYNDFGRCRLTNWNYLASIVAVILITKQALRPVGRWLEMRSC